jgi:2-polyprenyl-3-methyl-5-hydroxy-6-metoxy-1,4-benzoquinol methylase
MNVDAIAEFRTQELRKYDLEYFQTEYWKEDLPGKRGNGSRSYDDPDHRKRFDLLASAIGNTIRFDSLLDVGCGPGLLLRSLTPQHARLAGVDASETAIELAKNVKLATEPLSARADLFRADCTALPFDADTFDVVTCLDVLEHLPVFDVQSAIDEMIRVARRHLIVSINSDNPYHYHPTILSPGTWRAMLGAHGDIRHDLELEAVLAQRVAVERDEYSFYCYSVAEAS